MSMEHTDKHDTFEPRVWLKIDLRLPVEQVDAFHAAMTGNDDDILLVAETAMRERLGREYEAQEIELSWYEGSRVAKFLTEEGRINRERERLYGPVKKADADWPDPDQGTGDKFDTTKLD